MKKQKEVFKVYQDSDDNYYFAQNEDKDKPYKELELAVVRPTYQNQQEAQIVHSKTFTEFVKNGVATQSQLLDLMEDNDIWNKEKQEKERLILKEIDKNRIKLRKGKMKISEGVQLAKDNIKKLFDWLALVSRKNELFNNSAESRAEQARFDYLVSKCTVYNSDRKPVFESLEKYLEADAAGNPVPTIAGQYYAKLTQNLDEDFRADWPEYKFLKKFKLVDEKLRWINKDGHLVDEDGNLINDKGQLVDNDDVVIDNVVDEPEFFPG